MYEISLDRLHQLWVEGRAAAQYAFNHYEELASRKHKYTLFGPHAFDIGVLIPSSLTPESARILRTKTRRRNYIAYELDDDCTILRSVTVLDYTRINCTYHHFEKDGVRYAYPFRGNTGMICNDTISALEYENNKPIYFASVAKSMLFIQFYEYTDENKMLVSTYRYWPNSKYTQYGYPVDRNASFDSLNSPVTRHCREEVPHFVDFAQWMK